MSDGKYKSRLGAIDVVVVGGVASGTILQGVKVDAQFFELSRPTHLKPLTAPGQVQPEVVVEKQNYEMHPISLKNTGEHKPNLIGIAVPTGTKLTDAFQALISAYCDQELAKLRDRDQREHAPKNIH